VLGTVLKTASFGSKTISICDRFYFTGGMKWPHLGFFPSKAKVEVFNLLSDRATVKSSGLRTCWIRQTSPLSS
jgi:hypothetical protein